MKVPLSALLAASLLSGLSASSPTLNTRSQQIVLADVQDATALDGNLRQGDLVDTMIAEAKAKGQDLSSWGISSEEDNGEQKKGYGQTVETIDLQDEIARTRLAWEAALDSTTFSILPKKKKSSSPSLSSSKVNIAKPKTVQPGSGWVWSSCGTGNEAAVIKTLDVDPDPPQAGKNLTVHSTGIVNSPIHNGTYVDVVVKLGFVKFLQRRFDVCQLAEDNDAEIKCPVEPGEYEITQTAQLLKEIPPFKFNVHVSGKTHDGTDFVCSDLTIDFMHH